MADAPLTIADLLFVAFNGRVLAVDRMTGTPLWKWNSGKSSFVSLLPDGDLLFASTQGYTWALDPATGREIWHQPFKGEGWGIPTLATMRATSSSGAAAEQERQDAEAAAARRASQS
jgi:outer membrane protein assembly factor BamB